MPVTKLSPEHFRKLQDGLARARSLGLVRGWKLKNPRRGHTLSVEHRAKISEANHRRYQNNPQLKSSIAHALSAEKSPLWRGGVSSRTKLARASSEYREWRTSVFRRDDYRCLDCGERGGRLEADHIYPFSLYTRLRYMIENGRTLCRACHRKTNTFGKKLLLAISQKKVGLNLTTNSNG